MVTVSDLDAKALEVLEAIYETGGEADTSEIKEYTGIEKNGIIHYRYEKLEEADLIDRRTGDPDGSKVPPTVVSLTDEAREQIEGGLFGEEEATIVERMDRLERQYRRTHEALRDVQDDFQMWRFDPDADEEIHAFELKEHLEEVLEMGEDLREQVEAFESFESEQFRTDDLVEAVHRLEGRTKSTDSEIMEVFEDISTLAYLLTDADREDVEEDYETDVWALLEEEENRLDQLEAAVEEAKQTAASAREAADSLPDGLEDDITSLQNRQDQLEARTESHPSGSFFDRLRWLFTGSSA